MKDDHIPETFSHIKEYIEAIDKKLSEVVSSPYGETKENNIWPIFRLHHQKNRYIYMLHKTGKIDRLLMKYLLRKGIADKDLISFWNKRGYENLCCLRCVDNVSKNNNVCICRVPERYNDVPNGYECGFCGCRGCSGH